MKQMVNVMSNFYECYTAWLTAYNEQQEKGVWRSRNTQVKIWSDELEKFFVDNKIKYTSDDIMRFWCEAQITDKTYMKLQKKQKNFDLYMVWLVSVFEVWNEIDKKYRDELVRATEELWNTVQTVPVSEFIDNQVEYKLLRTSSLEYNEINTTYRALNDYAFWLLQNGVDVQMTESTYISNNGYHTRYLNIYAKVNDTRMFNACWPYTFTVTFTVKGSQFESNLAALYSPKVVQGFNYHYSLKEPDIEIIVKLPTKESHPYNQNGYW